MLNVNTLSVIHVAIIFSYFSFYCVFCQHFTELSCSLVSLFSYAFHPHCLHSDSLKYSPKQN